jgi:nucleoside-diphosphate-sugar epimerase
MSKLIFGCGYLGQRVAERWRDAGQEVFVVTRSADRAGRLAGEGFRPIVADILRPASLANLPTVETVLFAVGFDRSSGASIREVYAGGLRSVLDVLPRDTDRIIYTSSTGVYGQMHDEWVDEDSLCEPHREGGKACLEAEQVLATHPLAPHGVTLRLAGLYGPGRIPNADEIRNYKPIAASEQGYINLIHVDDAVEAVLAAAERAIAPRTYLVADGHPVPRRDYYDELAWRLGAPRPIFAPPAADSPQALRAGSSKRARNARMLVELGIKLRYPSYREGLAAIVASQQVDSRDRASVPLAHHEQEAQDQHQGPHPDSNDNTLPGTAQ